MLKLGYNPNCVQIVPPKLDNSNIIKPEPKTQAPPVVRPKPETAYTQNLNTGFTSAQDQLASDFKPPVIANIDDWSDFDDDD